MTDEQFTPADIAEKEDLINQEKQQADMTSSPTIKETTDNPDFQRLFPGYREYWENRPSAENPYLHGTGSYALRRVLREGLRPRGVDERHSGEAASHYWTPEEGQEFVSLATSDGLGDIVAAAYAYASSRDPSLTYNADSFFGQERTHRLIQAMGGIEGIIDTMVARTVSPENIDETEEIRETVRLELEFALEEGLNYGQYVFDQARAQRNIQNLQSLQSGATQDYHEIRRILYQNNIFRGRTGTFIKKELATLSDPESWLSQRLGQIITHWRESIESYESLPEAERAEIEDQFPVILMIEGVGLDIQDPHSPLPQERTSRSTISPKTIREIRVPERKIPLVQEWLREGGLGQVAVTPLEYYEMHEVVESREK